MANGALIVGGGQAGVALATALRTRGYDGPITIVGAEAALPYQRPPLSKGYLTGQQPVESLRLRKPEFYAANDVGVVTGCSITDIRFDTGPGAGGVAGSACGREFRFRDLALTLGATPKRLPLPGAEASNVFCLRTLTDADSLRTALEQVHRVVVIGGGFIGLEAAAALTQRGKNVTVVEAQRQLLGRVAGPLLGEFYLDAHRRRGVEVLLGSAVRELHTDTGEAVHSLTLTDGRQIGCDAVVVGIGLERDRRLADQLGLKWDDGIVVDEFARTSLDHVVAAGDCSVGSHIGAPGPVRLESVQNATDQAKVAAATLCGELEPYRSLPWFWSDQGPIKLQMAGFRAATDDTVVRGEPDTEQFSVLYVRDGHVTAIEAVNRPQDFAAAKKALAAGRSRVTDRHALTDPAVPLKQLLA